MIAAFDAAVGAEMVGACGDVGNAEGLVDGTGTIGVDL